MRQSPHGCVLGCKEKTAISASMIGIYKVFPIMPDNGKDRLLSTNAQNRLFFEQSQRIEMF
jgi:hypothetical protein